MRDEMQALLTGFEPFEEYRLNPSAMALGALPFKIENVDIVKLILPVIFDDASNLLINTLRSNHFDIVICTGLASDRNCITPERLAQNIKDARIPDNAGNQPLEETIVQNGEDVLYSTLPIEAIVGELTTANIPASISNSAGTYVCNEVMYRLLSFQKEERPDMQAGFIHVPRASELCSPEETCSLPLEKIIEAISICVSCTASNTCS